MPETLPAKKDNPGVIFPPPLLFLGALAVGLGLDTWLPLTGDWPRHEIANAIAFGLGAGGVVLMGWMIATFARVGTPVPTYKTPRAIATGGPFSFTRNPAYVGMALIYVAVALGFGRAWTWVLLLPLLMIVRYGVIGREERYLERKFGDEYRAYRARVRRWI